MLSATLTTNAIADCNTKLSNCNKIVDTCVATVDAKNKELDKAGKVVDNCVKLAAELEVQNQLQKEELDAWYRKPLLVGILGVALGGILGILVAPLAFPILVP